MLLRNALLALAVLALVACSGPRSRPSVAKPTTGPARSVPATTKPVAVPTPTTESHYEPDSERARRALGNNGRDASAASEVGYYMDVLQARLKQSLTKSTGIGRQGQHIALILPAGFQAGGAELSPALRAAMAPISKVLVEYRKTIISVRFRADAAAANANDVHLAGQRSRAVADYLSKAGVDSKRIVIAPTRNRAAPAKSAGSDQSRVELLLQPILRSSAATH